MALKPEAKFYARVKRDLEKLPHTYFWKTHELSRRGLPDVVACIYGRFVAFELKAERGRPSELQKIEIERINDAGGSARVVYPSEWDDVYTELVNFCQQIEAALAAHEKASTPCPLH